MSVLRGLAARLAKGRFQKFMPGKLVDFPSCGWMGYHWSTKENNDGKTCEIWVGWGCLSPFFRLSAFAMN